MHFPGQKEKEKIARFFGPIPFSLSLVAVIAGIYDFGYIHHGLISNFIKFVFNLALISGILSVFVRYLIAMYRPAKKIWITDLILSLFFIFLIVGRLLQANYPLFYKAPWTFIAIVIILIRENSAMNIYLKRKNFNPAMLFISSFVFVILSGTFLLKLPTSTYHGISFVNALFTSTSAVCVTGLSVVDTGTYFTSNGQLILIILMQLGGIGILTFTSYFSYFFKGGSSYENQLLLKDLTNTSKLTDIFKTLKRVIIATFIIEAIGALIIFFSMNKTVIANTGERIFFSVFHSVSGFCNAGFSTLQNNLFEHSVRYNYILQLTIAFLIILGGLGFPIVFNFMHYIKHLILNRFIPYLQGRETRHLPWVININSRIVVITTAILLIGEQACSIFSNITTPWLNIVDLEKLLLRFSGQQRHVLQVLTRSIHLPSGSIQL